MVSHRFRCAPNRLKLLLDDRLPGEGHAELARHIEACESCREKLEALAAEASWWNEAREFLHERSTAETSPPEHPSGRSGSAEGPSLDFLEPSDDPKNLGRLGPYEVEELIGSGGMGVVLKGLDSTLHRYVAIKVLAPQLAGSAAARRRFAREARAAAAIVHEHVVAIHAVDCTAGLPYLVMPLVAGRSLQQRLEANGPLRVEEILRIGMQTAAGLAAAHAQGLVHRDVKPANILLENGVERVMITDFGLARAVDDASLTCSGVVAGTPQYMSPEQADGRPVDPRADLFSLGSVMYAMCAGRSPFRAEGTMAVLRRICEDKPRPIREVNPEIPDWLAEIIAKLHEKDPDDRFQTAAELADLLGGHLAHLQHPSSVPMPVRLKRVSTSAGLGRRKALCRWIAASLLLAIAVFGVAEITGTTRMTAGLFGRKPPQTAGGTNGRRERSAENQSEAVPDNDRGRDVGIIPTSDDMPSVETVLPGGGFQQQVDSIRWGLCSIEDQLYEPPSEEPPPDALSRIGRELDSLEHELWSRSPDSMSDIAVRLDDMEQSMRRPPPSGPAIVDESLSIIGTYLDALEEELNTDWP